MGTISVTLPSDGETMDASDVNNPINTIVTAINGNLDSNNISAGGLTPANLVSGTGTSWAWQSWTPTITGYSANPTNATYTYTQIGKTVILSISEGTNGTSNATSKTYSLPVTARTLTNASWRTFAQIVNNGTGGQGLAIVASAGTTMSVFATTTGGNWTASGNASVAGLIMIYEAA